MVGGIGVGGKFPWRTLVEGDATVGDASADTLTVNSTTTFENGVTFNGTTTISGTTSQTGEFSIDQLS